MGSNFAPSKQLSLKLIIKTKQIHGIKGVWSCYLGSKKVFFDIIFMPINTRCCQDLNPRHFIFLFLVCLQSTLSEFSWLFFFGHQGSIFPTKWQRAQHFFISLHNFGCNLTRLHCLLCLGAFGVWQRKLNSNYVLPALQWNFRRFSLNIHSKT